MSAIRDENQVQAAVDKGIDIQLVNNVSPIQLLVVPMPHL